MKLAAAIVTLGMMSVPAHAAEIRDAATAPAITTAADAAPAAAEQITPGPAIARPGRVRLDWYEAHRRPMALPALYASLASLQVYDVYSTTRALANGAHEANPMMKNIVGNPALFWSVKAAATIAPMMAAERLWKKNKMAAVAMMVATNGVMAAVAAHNASVLGRVR